MRFLIISPSVITRTFEAEPEDLNSTPALFNTSSCWDESRLVNIDSNAPSSMTAKFWGPLLNSFGSGASRSISKLSLTGVNCILEYSDERNKIVFRTGVFVWMVSTEAGNSNCILSSPFVIGWSDVEDINGW